MSAGNAEQARLEAGPRFQQDRGTSRGARLRRLRLRASESDPRSYLPGFAASSPRRHALEFGELDRATRSGGEARFVRCPYRSRGVAKHIAKILDRFGGLAALAGLDPIAAAGRLADLYGDLDHAHGFYEGNSRTLREFTRELAAAAGFVLDWTGTGVGAAERNALYLARDLAVYEREFPGLDEARAMSTNDRREYEASFTLERLHAAVGAETLATIVGRRIWRKSGVGGEADAKPGFRRLRDAPRMNAAA